MKSIAILIAAAVLVLGVASARADDDDELGQDTFNNKCATCHGKDGKAKTEMGLKLKTRDLTQKDSWKTITDATIEKQVRNGTADQNMPAFAEKLSAEEIKAVIKYVRVFQPK